MAAYNIEGMNSHLWAAIVIYSLVGLLNIIFATGLFLAPFNKSISLIGKILISINGVVWLSFGILTYNPVSNMSNHILVMRVILVVTIGMLALFFLAAEFYAVWKDLFMKWYTFLSGLSILILSLLSIFIFNDETWVRTNVSLCIYFVWFGVFGMRVALMKPRTS